MPTKKGASRLLTPGEISMVTSLFKTAITTSAVRVHNDKYLRFQDENTAMTPNGELYWPQTHFREDYSLETVDYIHWFMHEMTHVWQYQMGMSVKIRGLFSFAIEYNYDLEKGNLLSGYRMEQQACILSDYYILDRFGFDSWYDRTRQKHKGDRFTNKQYGKDFWIKIYSNTLSLFLKNPKDQKALFE